MERLEKLVQLDCIYDQKVCFALQQNRVPFIKSIRIENMSEVKHAGLRLTITTNPSFIEPLEIEMEELAGLEAVMLSPSVEWSNHYLGSLEERIAGYMTIRLESEELLLYEQNMPVEVLTYDTWPGGMVLPEIIASFITPNRPFVREIIQKATTILQTEIEVNSLVGYKSGDPYDVLLQLSAIYSAIQSYNIAYTHPLTNFEINGQKIRFPDTIEAQKLGSCLDLTLLYAACAEYVGIHAMVIFFDGHMLPGFWLKDYCSAESYQDDKSIITKHMASGIHELLVVEATKLTERQVLFTDAVSMAQDSINKQHYFHYFIDVERSRVGQIMPISLPSEQQSTGENNQQSWQGEQAEAVSEFRFRMEREEAVSETDKKTVEQSIAEKRMQQWQYGLLDLSLRNQLLHFRPERQGIALAVADVSLLEDLLASGEKTFILPRPAEWDASFRNFDSDIDLTTSHLLQADMKNKRVRSFLTEGELNKRLVNLYRRAKNRMEESGSNSLFVAIGLLKWFESSTHKEERYAPILLLPVELVRLSIGRGYYIRIRDEEIQVNISLIEHLKQKFGIDASSLYDTPKDDHGADVNKILTTMRRLIMGMERWDVMDCASIGIFSFSKFVMWYDLVHRTDDLLRNKVVQSLLEGKCTWSANEQMHEALSAEQDEGIHAFVPLSYDSTQMEAILAASHDNSFVLHGPPGSGKSQTITNMISHALASGKTVLFVAEKMAALRVVHHRLSQLGLDPFCLEVYSNKAQKKDVLAQLEASYAIQGKVADTNWQQTAEEIKVQKQQLNDYVRALHSTTNLGQTIFEMIEYFSSLPALSFAFDLDHAAVSKMDEQSFKQNCADVRQLAIAGGDCRGFLDNPLLGMKQATYSLAMHDLIANQLKQIEQYSPDLLRLMDTFCSRLGISVTHQNYAFFMLVSQLATSLLDIPIMNVSLIAHPTFEQFKIDVLTILEVGQRRDQLKLAVLEIFDEAVFQIDSEQLLIELRTADNSWFLKKWTDKRKVDKAIKGYKLSKEKLSSEQLQQYLEKMRAVKQCEAQLLAFDQPMVMYFMSLWSTGAGNWTEISTALTWAEQVRHTLLEMTTGIEPFVSALQQEQSVGVASLQQLARELLAASTKVRDAWQVVAEELRFPAVHLPDLSSWIAASLAQSSQLLSSLDTLPSLCQLSRVVQQLDANGLSNITEPYLQGLVATEQLEDCYILSFYRMRIDAEIVGNPVLSTFSGSSFEEKIACFVRLDEEIAELTKLEVYVRLMRNTPNLFIKSIENSEPAILTRAIRGKGRGISIRKLFERIPNLLPRIKPCMLMSPLSVAQYLHPTFPTFDLIIFDEASQLPTSEAIGAIARGTNVIVVGDPKQLPPTSFFKAQAAEHDDFEMQDLESVLDDCLAMQMPQKHLRWHYRSEHESLISFSNNHFYGKKLITTPSVDDQQTRVSFRQVNGVYDRGGTKVNEREAISIVDEIFVRLADPMRQRESIGVVTFSEAQQTFIEDLIDERLKEDSTYESYFTDEVAEPVFVKNLENVQGDERDIILFSIGYGPDSDGKLTMNFGPLNREGGWRRLNVAVSRAKKEMVLFASMEPETIDLSRTNADGVKALRAFMEYAKSGKEAVLIENRQKNHRENSKVIADKLAAFLQKHGYQVVRNLGNSDFKVDIAVKDPQDHSKYIAAIQIDGHQYGEIVTPRDREVLRTQLLQKYGWEVMKVWSIDWWHNESKQLAYVLEKLNELSELNELNRFKQEVAEPANTFLPEHSAEEAKPSIEEQIQQLMIPGETLASTVVVYPLTELEPVSLPNSRFYTSTGAAIILKQIKSVIKVEAPISFSELVTRIITAWGFARSGAKIEQVVQELLEQVNAYIVDESNGKFIWKSKEQYDTFALFRMPDVYRRSPANISEQEYRSGVEEIIAQALQLPREDAVRELAKKAGYTRNSKVLTDCANYAIDALIESGTIEENGEMLVYRGK